MNEVSTVWQVRYINDGESHLRKIILETANPSISELAEELEANELAADRIVSIRNVTLKHELKKK